MVNQELIARIENDSPLSAEAKSHIVEWLTSDKYNDYVAELESLIMQGDWSTLEDNFFRVIPFGTGGRRGTVGVGSNRINKVTIGETVQALSTYLKVLNDVSMLKGVAIAYDSRLTSESFARYCAQVLAANGIKAFIFDGPRATPELSFTVRHLNLDAGIVITASHNPSPDNGIKLYWKDGGQLIPPHDSNILEVAEKVYEISETDYDRAVGSGMITVLADDVDQPYWDAVLAVSQSDNRDTKVAYSPLHGTGITSVYQTLLKAGFTVDLFEEQAAMDGAFPNVADNIPNPELPKANEKVAGFALKNKSDIALTNDPDADRFCVLVNDGSVMQQLTGNQATVLMTDYLLAKLNAKGELSGKHFISSTIVTTDMLHAIAKKYSVSSVHNLLVGFKYISEQVHLRCDQGDQVFVSGAEESYGGIVGTYCRDKDGASPSLLIAELAGELKAEGKTLLDKLDDLYIEHGVYHEELDSIYFYGAKGFETMKSYMHHVRTQAPDAIAGMNVTKVRDYLQGVEIEGRSEDVMRFEVSADGKNRITIRPSGTEPKLKLYTQVFEPVSGDLEDAKKTAKDRAALLKKEFIESVNQYQEKMNEEN